MTFGDFLADLGTYGFLQKAAVTSVAVGIISGLIGCFIVLRGLALMGDAISHAVLPGVAISYLLNVNFFVGALAFGLLTALGIGAISQHSRIKHDSSIGIVFSAFLALGVLLIAKAQTAQDLTKILFGNVLAVRTADMQITLAVGAVVIALLLVFYKQFFLSTFDPTMARVSGIRVRWLHYALMIMLTLVTVAALQTVGVILVVAMLVIPASTAYLLVGDLPAMLALSALFGAVSSLTGLYLSYSYNLGSGPVIVLVATAFFLLAFFFSPHDGLVTRLLRSMKTRSRVISEQASASR